MRLQGCSVGCAWCDTKETWATDQADYVVTLGEAIGTNSKRTGLAPREIAAVRRQNVRRHQVVLVDGGEPAEQPLELLVEASQTRLQVAIETSGRRATLWVLTGSASAPSSAWLAGAAAERSPRPTKSNR